MSTETVSDKGKASSQRARRIGSGSSRQGFTSGSADVTTLESRPARPVEIPPREATPSSDAAKAAPARRSKPAPPNPKASIAASGTKRKRAPSGTFDRKAYQRELMRKRRAAEKAKKNG